MNQGKLFLELEEQDVRKIFDVNTLAHFWTCKEFLGDMIKHNSGHIVNVASVCGLMGTYKLTDYCATKFAAVGFSESLRVELKVTNKFFFLKDFHSTSYRQKAFFQR
jgi:all-trans-retinol dehydrogenase (NAD+)